MSLSKNIIYLKNTKIQPQNITPTQDQYDSAQLPPSLKKYPVKYNVPVQGILKDYDDGAYWKIDPQTNQAADVLMNTLKEFKITAEVTGIRKGPVITMFEILPAPGVKLSKIVNLENML